MTESSSVHQAVLSLRDQGDSPTARYHHDRLGHNYRMTTLAAAVLLGQLERAEALLERRRQVVAQYRTLLSEVPESRLQSVAPGASAAPWLVSVQIDGADTHRRDRVIHAMLGQGIETRPVFLPVQQMPYCSSMLDTETPVSDAVSRGGLSLPNFPDLTEDQINDVVGGLQTALAATRGE